MPRPLITLILPLAAGLILSACRVELNDPGTEPRPAEMFYPAGIAIDPEEPYLYVSNGNSDLRFGGGTVQIMDIERFDCAVRYVKGQPFDGVRCTSAAADAGSCVQDALDPTLVNCDEKPFALPNATVKVGNFAGNIRVQHRGGQTRRLFVSVRGDPSITWIDVDFARDRGRPRLLDCFDRSTNITARAGYNADTNTTTVPPGCDPSHLIQTYTCIGQPSCTQGVNTIPIEPFSMRLDDGVFGEDPTRPYSRLVVSHLSAGQVMLVDVLSAPFVRSVSNPFFTADANNRRGAFALAPQRPGDPSSMWYMTSNLQPVIATFRIAEVGVIVPSVNFSVGGVFANSGTDVRDIQFEPGGNRAFFSENNPPTVGVLDTRILPSSTTPSFPVNQVVDIVNVCQTPSHLGVRRVELPGAPGAPPRAQTRLYVVCFLSNQIMVVDPDVPTVLDTTLVGRGPNDIAFSEKQQRAYVTNFGEWTIGVIDLERGSPTENRMVARLGIPEPLVPR